MVEVNRQVSARPPVNNSPATILRRAAPLSSIKPAPLKILIYGGNRTGKTTLACQFKKPLLVVSFEPSLSGGIDSVRRMPGISLVRVLPDGHHQFKSRTKDDPIISADECVTLANDLRRSSEFATVVFDGVTSCQDLVGANLMDLPEVPDQKGWGLTQDRYYIERSEKLRAVVRPYIDMPLDTIFLAKEKDHNPPTEEKVTKKGNIAPDMRPRFLRGVNDKSFVAPEAGGGPVGWLMDACECVCRLYLGQKFITKKVKVGSLEKEITEEVIGQYTRYLRTCYHPNYAGGVRSPWAFDHPEMVPDEIVDPTPEKIIRVIRGS